MKDAYVLAIVLLLAAMAVIVKVQRDRAQYQVYRLEQEKQAKVTTEKEESAYQQVTCYPADWCFEHLNKCNDELAQSKASYADVMARLSQECRDSLIESNKAQIKETTEKLRKSELELDDTKEKALEKADKLLKGRYR